MNYCAIIVGYYPGKSLGKIVSVLDLLGICSIIVDNTPHDSDEFRSSEGGLISNNHFYYSMGKNTGIAAAQNYGITVALKKSKDVILFFDQDSIVSSQMIKALLTAFESGDGDVLAPVCLDNNDVEIPSFLINKYGFSSKVFSKNNSQVVHLAISSGCLVKSSVFEAVGTFDENLFIDYVDFEWCFRCWKKGVFIKVISDAVMHHNIGYGTVYLGSLKTTNHSPFRTFYKLRNPLLLLKKSHIPKTYCFLEIILSIKCLMVQIIHGPSRIDHLKRGFFGFLEGVFSFKKNRNNDV